MPRGEHVTEFEMGKIFAMHEENKSIRQIAEDIGRSPKLVHSTLHRPPNERFRKRTGRKPKLSDRTNRLIGREASNKLTSSAEIKANLDLNVHRVTVYRSLANNPHLANIALMSKPKITKEKRAARLAWAQAHMAWQNTWPRVIFSDEKKFNLDGPDGFKYYWHDLRKDRRIFSKRNYGGGSLMIWLGVSRDFKSTLYVVDGKMNSKKYIQLLTTAMLPLKNQTAAAANATAIFQQDKASIHRSAETTAWFQQQNIDVLDWPTSSPDVNPMENLWGILAREVYRDNRQFQTVEELRDAILQEWNGMSQDTVRAVIDSMPNRIFQVIQANGKATKY